ATHKGIGIAGGLRRQVPGEGNNHSRRHLSCIPFRKAECAVMRDLIRGSLTLITNDKVSSFDNPVERRTV
ncbi:MAG: hypothetical protein ABL865_03295, partial [Candidatus Nitrotoga sp.]